MGGPRLIIWPVMCGPFQIMGSGDSPGRRFAARQIVRTGPDVKQPGSADFDFFLSFVIQTAWPGVSSRKFVFNYL